MGLCNLDFCKPVAQDQMLSFPRLRAIDMYKFSSDLEDTVLIRSHLNDDLSLAIDQFNSTLQSMIDNHAQSFVGLLLFALMRHGLRMKLKLQREREENWKDDGARITPKLITYYTPNIAVR